MDAEAVADDQEVDRAADSGRHEGPGMFSKKSYWFDCQGTICEYLKRSGSRRRGGFDGDGVQSSDGGLI